MLLRKCVWPVVLASVVAVGCSEDDQKQMEEPVQAETTGEHTFKVDDQTGKIEFQAEIVYFEFDSSILTKEGMERLDALAEYMNGKGNEAKNLEISGHCDERGSTEYNLALGARRAEAVKQYLANTRQIPAPRLNTVSFGEEKPAEQGRDESAWSKNRRAEFKFTTMAK